MFSKSVCMTGSEAMITFENSSEKGSLSICDKAFQHKRARLNPSKCTCWR